MLSLQKTRIAVIGLGYVGLPLAVEFGKQYRVIGFDVNKTRVDELNSGSDSTLEVSKEQLLESNLLCFSNDVESLKESNVFIVTVPTPIDKHKQPDLDPLLAASEMIGTLIKKGGIVIYESTVYPGATEDECIPVIEKSSGLVFNTDFFAGYSPERINPGDKQHRLTNILKVTSGSTERAASFVDDLYSSIILAGTYKASSIKVAEAAKVIENTQRDVNIALINELSIIFNKLNIDTLDVLEAAGTKWNFLPFRPGLVGGHCIGVDPFYLTHKAQSVGYHPEMILAGRRLNDSMGKYVVSQLLKSMIRKQIAVQGARVLVMGLTFKENCPDLRNSKVIDIVSELGDYNINVDIVDPWCSEDESRREYGLSILKTPKQGHYDAIVIAVAHSEFSLIGIDKIRALGKKRSIVYDLKHIFPKSLVDIRL